MTLIVIVHQVGLMIMLQPAQNVIMHVLFVVEHLIIVDYVNTLLIELMMQIVTVSLNSGMMEMKPVLIVYSVALPAIMEQLARHALLLLLTENYPIHVDVLKVGLMMVSTSNVNNVTTNALNVTT